MRPSANMMMNLRKSLIADTGSSTILSPVALLCDPPGTPTTFAHLPRPRGCPLIVSDASDPPAENRSSI